MEHAREDARESFQALTRVRGLRADEYGMKASIHLIVFQALTRVRGHLALPMRQSTRRR